MALFTPLMGFGFRAVLLGNPPFGLVAPVAFRGKLQPPVSDANLIEIVKQVNQGEGGGSGGGIKVAIPLHLLGGLCMSAMSACSFVEASDFPAPSCHCLLLLRIAMHACNASALAGNTAPAHG